MIIMSCYAVPGTKVRFAYPNNGYEYQQETAAKYLTIGAVYTVHHTSVGGFSTSVWLEEIGIDTVSFNSVMFEEVTEEPNESA